MYITRLFLRSARSRWLLMSFIMGSFFTASWSEAGQRPAPVDLTKVKITLYRSPCLGTCPDYTVTIHGDGRVVFAAPGWPGDVLLPGMHEDRIAPENVAALFAQGIGMTHRIEIIGMTKWVCSRERGPYRFLR